MHALQPVHFALVTATIPPSPTCEAPVGQASTQEGELQWLQRSERISMERLGKAPLTSWTIQSRKPPPGRAFSVLQEMTQALQPTQRTVSTAMAKRFFMRTSTFERGLRPRPARRVPCATARGLRRYRSGAPAGSLRSLAVGES